MRVLLRSRSFHLLCVSCRSNYRKEGRNSAWSAWNGNAYLESHGIGVRVLQSEGLRYLMLEGSWETLVSFCNSSNNGPIY